MPDPLQRLIAGALAILSLPLVAVLAVAIRLESSGPPIYHAERMGREAIAFRCFKLRTMRMNSGEGPAVTVGGDSRVSRVGAILRRFRLDELPQLWNVARGEMRFVGPRPEAPRFVDLSTPLHSRVFSAVPGITGLAQLVYVDEASMLDGLDPEDTYRTTVLPAKLQLDIAYLDRRSPSLDLWILARTIGAVAGRPMDLETIEARLGVSLKHIAKTRKPPHQEDDPA
ncbi:MAG: sugar transferase [Chloroflexota bacterium]